MCKEKVCLANRVPSLLSSSEKSLASSAPISGGGKTIGRMEREEHPSPRGRKRVLVRSLFHPHASGHPAVSILHPPGKPVQRPVPSQGMFSWGSRKRPTSGQKPLLSLFLSAFPMQTPDPVLHGELDRNMYRVYQPERTNTG